MFCRNELAQIPKKKKLVWINWSNKIAELLQRQHICTQLVFLPTETLTLEYFMDTVVLWEIN